MRVATTDAITDADRRFFERRPDRTYRMRRMAKAEIATLEAVAGGTMFLPPGSAPFTLIKNLAPGVRIRAFVPGPVDEDGSDLTDAQCAWMWKRSPGACAREVELRAALAKRGERLA